MGQALAAAQAASAGRELELVEKGALEELQEEFAKLEEKYQEALVLLRLLKSKAARFAGSGNPGLRAAGQDILDTIFGVR